MTTPAGRPPGRKTYTQLATGRRRARVRAGQHRPSGRRSEVHQVRRAVGSCPPRIRCRHVGVGEQSFSLEHDSVADELLRAAAGRLVRRPAERVRGVAQHLSCCRRVCCASPERVKDRRDPFGQAGVCAAPPTGAVATTAEEEAMSTPTKPSIVFAHGIWADGSCFNKLVTPLEAEGHEVISAQYGLNSNVEDVAATVRYFGRVSSPIILVGHSYGGAVITAAGTDDRVAGLLYIAALGPDETETSESEQAKFPVTPAPRRRRTSSRRPADGVTASTAGHGCHQEAGLCAQMLPPIAHAHAADHRAAEDRSKRLGRPQRFGAASRPRARRGSAVGLRIPPPRFRIQTQIMRGYPAPGQRPGGTTHRPHHKQLSWPQRTSACTRPPRSTPQRSQCSQCSPRRPRASSCSAADPRPAGPTQRWHKQGRTTDTPSVT